MDRAWIRRLLQLTGVTVALALHSGMAAAQTAVFSGRVTSLGQPLGGATVGIPELGVGSVTGTDGRYNFTVDVTRARGRTLNVVARYIGYKPKTMAVTLAAGRTEKDFELEKDVLNLEQVVVTGVSDATSQKKTAFAVGVVDASQLKESPQASSPLAGLSGRVAGASVVTTSGQPGTPPAVRLRSATSLTGRQDPLVIVDGTISRLSLADINSEDIDRVEVIKGAAASSLYGSDAANGVIQIFTKRGANLAEGQLVLTVRNEYGQSRIGKKIGRNDSHEYQLNASGQFAYDANGNRIPEADRIADNRYPVYYDQQSQVFKPGTFLTNYVSVGQRRGTTNFAASFQNTKETGVLTQLTGFGRQNFRINLDQALSDKVDISTGAFYGRSHADQVDDSGLNMFFGMRFLEPNVRIDSITPQGLYNAVIKQPPLSGNVINPLYYLSQRETTNERDRFTGTFKLRYRPTTWLTADGNVNYDVSNQNYKDFEPLGYLNSSGAKSKGTLFQSGTSDRSYNTGMTVTAVKTTSWFTNTTKAAWVYEDQNTNNFNVNASALTVPKVPEFGAAAQDPNNPIIPGSSTLPIRNQNYFVITTFDIKDRYIVDGLVRRDESSLFGSEQRGQTYQRFSAAWRVSEDLRIGGVDELKLRASYGTAGLRPVFDAQYEAFAITGGSPTKITLGNANLKPAFSKETEVGFNVNFLRDYTFEYTYSDKNTNDQILNVPVSSATGYRSQWINAGTLSGQTHEVAVGAVLASKADFFWRVNLAADRTRQRITDLKVAPFLVGPNAADANTRIFRIAEGERFGVIYGSRWIKTADQLATALSAGKHAGTAADYQLNEEGFYVAKSAYRTASELPLKAYDKDGNSLTAIGDVNPDFNLSLNSNTTWRSLSVSALLNWVKGGNIYNYTRQWPFNEQRDAVYDQAGKPAAERKPVSYYQAFYNNFDANEYFVEDGSFIRLRELAVNWQLPSSLVRSLRLANFTTARLGIVGRNLWTSTKYSGYDPDVSGPGGGNPFAYRVDYFTYPSYRTFTVMLELGY